jgi:putative transposase|nr:MAG TPA: transposase [Caudoviricetes sp.]
MEWVDMQTTADLEGETYHTIQMRYLRGYYEHIHKKPDKNGGKDRVYIAVESLSERAQSLYKRRKRAEIERRSLERQGVFEEENMPWYYGIDIAWYLNNYHDEYLQKCNLAAEIEKYLQEKPNHRKQTTEFTNEFAKSHLDMSGKNFRRYLKRYTEGVIYAQAAELETGKNYGMYKILALCKPPKKGRHTVLTEEMKADIENLWACPKYHQNMQTMRILYEEFCTVECNKEVEHIPSYQTVRRYVEVIRSNNSAVKPLLQYGIEGFRHTAMIKRRRDLKKLKVMEVVQGDAHTFDCWTKYVQPNGKVTAIRPYLVGFIDMRSRCLVGWGICVQPNAEVIKQTLIHMIYPKRESPIEGVPRVVYIDNGKDFTAQTLTGRPRAQRFDIDNEIKGFYKSLGIEYDKRALPYTPWTKAQIERFFGTLIQGFTKRFTSYTGTLTGSKTAGKVKKDIKGMLERGELYTLDEFAAMFEVYINDVYHQKQHGGLKDQGETTPVPIKVYEDGERYYKAAPPLDYVLSLLGKTVERNVYNVGIELCGQTYMHEALGEYVGEKVLVRYHDSDMSCISVYNADGKQICTASTYEGLHPLAEQDDEQLTEHIKAQGRQLKRAREDIKALQTPYQERGLQLPELADEPPKITTLPQDRQYREKLAERKPGKKEEKETIDNNEFMRQQAEKAFKRIG